MKIIESRIKDDNKDENNDGVRTETIILHTITLPRNSS